MDLTELLERFLVVVGRDDAGSVNKSLDPLPGLNGLFDDNLRPDVLDSNE